MEYASQAEYQGNPDNAEFTRPARFGEGGLPVGLVLVNGAYKVVRGVDIQKNSEKKRLEAEAEKVFDSANKIYEKNALGNENVEALNEAYFTLKSFWDNQPGYVGEKHVRLINQILRLMHGSGQDLYVKLSGLNRVGLKVETAKLLLQILINLANSRRDTQTAGRLQAELNSLH